MTSAPRRNSGPAPRRNFNSAVTRFWSLAAPVYDLPWLQHWGYRPAQDEVLTVLRDHKSRTVADIACGTGILADRMQRKLRVDAVYGVDMADGMLAQARARSAEVTWLTAPAEQLPFDDGQLDAVVSTSAFHFFDQPAALREFRRVIRPGGLVVITSISPRIRLPLPRLLAPGQVPAHNASPEELRELFEDAGLTVAKQHWVHRPLWTLPVSDLLTVGVKDSA